MDKWRETERKRRKIKNEKEKKNTKFKLTLVYTPIYKLANETEYHS